MIRSSSRAPSFFNIRFKGTKTFVTWRPMDAPIETITPHSENKKRNLEGGYRHTKRQRTKKIKPVKESDHDKVLLADVRALLKNQNTQEALLSSGGENDSLDNTKLPELFTEIEVRVQEISSTGHGLGFSGSEKNVYVVPFSAPDDVVLVKVVKHFTEDQYSLTDFVKVIKPSALRDDSRIQCKYFQKCSGCQFQMLDYEEQLKHKRNIIEKAYRNFSLLSDQLIPSVEATIGSPLKYGYRTKLTPHFDGPPGHRSRQNRRNGVVPTFEQTPPIGFNLQGRPKILDIEDCPIGTAAVRLGLTMERLRLQKKEELANYRSGATILLRESTKRIPREQDTGEERKYAADAIVTSNDTFTDVKTCITDNKGVSTEYVDSFQFTNQAGSFFQNNNSILPLFTQYIHDRILPQTTTGELNTTNSPKYLIDAYSGSGLFTITLSSLFKSSVGIDIDRASIEFARKNAALNNIPSSQASFIAADASELFKSVTYPADETIVVIDPPRKGCDESFLNQLMKFAPKRVVYISCNVHTQARDVGVLVKGKENVSYLVESLRGFDFFPQTSHVEGVAILSRVEQEISTTSELEATTK